MKRMLKQQENAGRISVKEVFKGLRYFKVIFGPL
jgi:hypothetical protein